MQHTTFASTFRVETNEVLGLKPFAGGSCDRLGWFVAAVLAWALSGRSTILYAQERSGGPVQPGAVTAEMTGLPDSPGPQGEISMFDSGSEQETQSANGPVKDPGPASFGEFLKGTKEPQSERSLVAPIYHRYILPDEIAQPLTHRQRLIFGFHQPLSPFFLLTIVAASGYEQARNSSPHYGSNITAYDQRLGAAAIRNASQSVFSDSLMAPLLHEDPRYYIQGGRQNALLRSAYAISRVLVTRKDEGGATPNYALFAGYAAAAALNNAYYPAVDVGFRQTGRSFVGSLIGVALGNIVREFLPDALRAAHLSKVD